MPAAGEIRDDAPAASAKLPLAGNLEFAAYAAAGSTPAPAQTLLQRQPQGVANRTREIVKR